jgi:magnesium transporter
VIVDCAVYEHGHRRPGRHSLEDAYTATRGTDAFVWVGVHEPTQEEFENVRHAFSLHELAVEDAIKAHQRPKLELYDDSLFIVLKPVAYHDREESLEFGEIQLFVGANFVVSVRHGKPGNLREARHRIEARPDLLNCGPSAVVYGILDKVVDEYREVVTSLEEDVQQVETQVFSQSGPSSAERIYRLRREVLEFHTATAPFAEPIERLVRRRVPFIHEEITDYFRDVYDHLVLVVQQAAGFRELLANAMDVHLSSTSTRLNATMKQLTVVASLFLPLTFITGFFGMNFGYLVSRIGGPETFAAAVALMLLSVAVQVMYYRRQGVI